MAEAQLRIVGTFVDSDREVWTRFVEHLQAVMPATEIEELSERRAQRADAAIALFSPAYLASGLAEAELGMLTRLGVRTYTLIAKPIAGTELPRVQRLVYPLPLANEPDATLRGVAERLAESLGAARQAQGEPVSAHRLVADLLRDHPSIGERLGPISIDEGVDEGRRPYNEWLDDVRRIFRVDRVPHIDPLVFIRGMAMLHPPLGKDLLADGFLQALQAELGRPLLEMLTDEGLWLLEAGEVPAHADRPAKQDELGRRVFARALARMIVDEKSQQNEGAFLMHLHGPWGSGKTSLLGFLGEELQDRRWVAVEFNAWQHERLGVPWWAMMESVHRQASKRVPLWPRIRLAALMGWWRVKPARWWLAILAVGTAACWLAIDRAWLEALADKRKFVDIADAAKALAAVVTLAGALAGLGIKLARSGPGGVSEAAERFVRATPDPMAAVVARYRSIVRAIGSPVVVFVDDMDRCQANYVVELLNGIQTALIDAPVTYVVAADRRWLYDSYSKIYADFKSVGKEPGRPMAHLFLEKTFQLSASVPQLSSRVRDRYWRRLIQGDAAEPFPLDAVRTSALREAGLDEVLSSSAAADHLASSEGRAAVIAAASERAESAEVQQEIEHRLLPFAHLLERNPRAMKRLINAYRIELQRLIAEGRQAGSGWVTPEQLVLWTIISLRWPLLADALAEDPRLMGDAERPTPLRRLLDAPEVRRVLAGDGLPSGLSEAAIRALAGLDPRPAERSVA